MRAAQADRVRRHLEGEDIRPLADETFCHLLDAPSVIGKTLCGKYVVLSDRPSHEAGDPLGDVCYSCARGRCPECLAAVPGFLEAVEAAKAMPA